MIEVAELRKEFGETVAVDGASFTVVQGEIFGLLGPNGAGKSTTIGCISGLLKPSSGHVRVLGFDVVSDSIAAKSELGIVPQELALYEDLSARENLAYWGNAYGLHGQDLKQRVVEVLEICGLLDRADDVVKKFSGGMKRRLNFGCGIVHRPKVILLDEPTVGVDPQSRVRLLDLVRAEANKGASVLYTTHYMEEAQDLCDRLAIIDKGQVVAMGTLEELRGMMGERDLVRISGTFDRTRTETAVAALTGVELVSVDEETLMLAAKQGSRLLPQLFACLAAAGAEVRETTLSRPNLENLFIKLTGRELRE
jgi:ABC-2 type transport system ATP-binding protein